MTDKLLSDGDEAIMKSSLTPILDDFLLPPSHDLYHYTSGDGFMKIVEDKRLLATHISCLNDTSEVLHAMEKFKLKLEAKLKETLPTSLRRLFARFKEAVDAERIENSPIYVACFSAAEDDLNQWRAYGGGEGGYCIQFDGTELRKKDGTDAILVKIWYGEAEQERILNQIIEVTERTFSAMSAYRQDLINEDLIDEFFENWLKTLYFLTPCFKNHKFSAEAEWRYVAYLGNRGKDARRFVQKSSMLVRQIYLNWSSQLPITGITVGPCRHLSQSMSAAAEYMEMHGYKINAGFIKQTAVPFRQL